MNVCGVPACELRRTITLQRPHIYLPFTFKLYLGKAVCAICLLLDEYEDRKKTAGRCKDIHKSFAAVSYLNIVRLMKY